MAAYKYKTSLDIKFNMRNITELIEKQKVVEKQTPKATLTRVNESATPKPGDVIKSEAAREIVDSNKYTPNPELVVSDNQKMKQLAVLFMGQLKKNCNWEPYYHPTFKTIDGAKTILFLDAKTDMAVTLTPIGENSATSVLRYYKEYDLEKDSQTATFVVSSEQIGMVKMFGVLFDIINNPDDYAKEVNEARKETNFKDDWKLGSEKRFRTEVDDILAGKDSNLKNVTKEGLEKLVEIVKGDKTIDPVTMAREMINRTPKGDEYLKILYGGEIPRKVTANHKLCTIVQTICQLAGIQIQNEKAVGVSNATVSGEGGNLDLTYNGVDVGFLVTIGMSYEEFVRYSKEYENILHIMDVVIRDMVDYTKMGRKDKLKNVDGWTALFISGIGGIGKTQTWEDIKDELKLVEGRDYAERGNSAVNAKALYEFVYENNGKLLVFDDTPDLFTGSSFTTSFWKKALEPKGKFPRITAPQESGSRFYSVKDCMENDIINYRKMYYMECPKQLSKKDTRNKSEEEIKKMEKESLVRMIPDEMNAMSKYLIITNSTEKEMSNVLGESSWGAIKTRVVWVEVAPVPAVIWAKIKQTLVKIRDEKKEDGMIPYEFVDQTIEIVEDLLSTGDAGNLNFRIFADGNLKKSMLKGLDWKLMLTQSLKKVE